VSKYLSVCLSAVCLLSVSVSLTPVCLLSVPVILSSVSLSPVCLSPVRLFPDFLPSVHMPPVCLSLVFFRLVCVFLLLPASKSPVCLFVCFCLPVSSLFIRLFLSSCLQFVCLLSSCLQFVCLLSVYLLLPPIIASSPLLYGIWIQF